jgi:hypothetical protein
MSVSNASLTALNNACGAPADAGLARGSGDTSLGTSFEITDNFNSYISGSWTPLWTAHEPYTFVPQPGPKASYVLAGPSHATWSVTGTNTLLSKTNSSVIVVCNQHGAGTLQLIWSDGFQTPITISFGFTVP